MYLKFTEHIIKFHVVALSKITPKITEKFIASLSIVKCYKIIATFRVGEKAQWLRELLLFQRS